MKDHSAGNTAGRRMLYHHVALMLTAAVDAAVSTAPARTRVRLLHVATHSVHFSMHTSNTVHRNTHRYYTYDQVPLLRGS